MSTANGTVTPVKYAHVGYEGSLEKARRTLAKNDLTKYEEERARQKEEQVKQRRQKAEQLMIARLREEEKRRTGEELGAKLLGNLRDEVLARMEAQHREEVRANAEKDRQIWYDQFVEFEKVKIREQLKEELEPMIKAQLTVDSLDAVKQALEIELTPEVESAIRQECTQRLEGEVHSRLQLDLRQDVIEQIRQQYMQQVIDQLRNEHKDGVINDLRTELFPGIKRELRDELANQITRREQLNGITTFQSSEDMEQHHDQPLPSSPSKAQEHDGQGASDIGLATDELYPDIENKANEASAESHGPQNIGARSLTALDTSSNANGETVDGNACILPQPEHPAMDHDGDTGAGAYETAPEPKDRTFNPEIHQIKFSSPIASDSGGKRSFGCDEDVDKQPTQRFKRMKREKSPSEDDIDNEDAYEAKSNPTGNSLKPEHAEDLGVDSEAGQESSVMDPEEGYGSGELEYQEEEEEEIEYLEEDDGDVIAYKSRQRQIRSSNRSLDDQLLEYRTASDSEDEEDEAEDEDNVDAEEAEEDDGDEEEENESEDDVSADGHSRPNIPFSNSPDTPIKLDDSDDEAEPANGKVA